MKSISEIEDLEYRSLPLVSSSGTLRRRCQIWLYNSDWRLFQTVRAIQSSVSSRRKVFCTFLMRWCSPKMPAFESLTREYSSMRSIVSDLTEEALYVGDNFVQDVLGAKMSGMKVIWLTNKSDGRNLNFDAVARSIIDVPGIIEDLFPKRTRDRFRIQVLA